jgi:hypothetical protein
MVDLGVYKEVDPAVSDVIDGVANDLSIDLGDVSLTIGLIAHCDG